MGEKKVQHYFKSMDDYIQKTPENLLEILKSRQAIVKDALALLSSEQSEIILLGSGSSYTAALSAKYYLQKTTKKMITLLYPNNVLRYEHLNNKNALVIGISQSGNSVAAIEAIRRMKKEGYPAVALTSDRSSQMAQSADAVLDISIGEESCGPKTMGYSCTLFLLMLLGLEYGRREGIVDEKTYMHELENAENTILGMPRVRDDVMQWYEKNRERLIGVEKISCVGYGANFGTAVEGSLKLIETVRCPAFGYEFEEFLHGPNDGIDRNSTIFLLGSREEELERMKKLQEFANGITTECFLFTNDFTEKLKNVVPVHFTDAQDFMTLEYVIVLQYLAYRISKDKAIDLNTIKYPEYYTIMNCKTKI